MRVCTMYNISSIGLNEHDIEKLTVFLTKL